MREVMLTTVDNPFNPFDNFEEWFKIDMQFGYNTCALVARIAPSATDALPDKFANAMQEECIDRWCRMFPLTYKKVVREIPDPDYKAMLQEDEDYSDYYSDDDSETSED